MRHGNVLRSLCSLLLLVALLFQGTLVLAGTTGGLNGTAVDASGTGIPNAKIAVVSPSQSATTQTDATGHFSFISLAPDTYVVSVEKENYEPASISGVTILSDQNQTIRLQTQAKLKLIGSQTVRNNTGNLVKAGTTSDVYSVNAATQDKVAALGGGGNLNSAISAVASVPGVYVPIGGQGTLQTFYIRGSTYSQIGYEFDGVPINRAFDNYQGTALSNLGQQELQVYTGGTPSSSSAATVAGFINQVVRTGTYPGFASLNFGVGAPSFYHNFKAEVGGATPNRNFSYYAGFTGYNQDFRLYDNFDGRNLTSDPNRSGLFSPVFSRTLTPSFGGVIPACPNPTSDGNAFLGGANAALDAGCYGLYPLNVDATGFGSQEADREGVLNLHFGIPHHKDGGKDDIQFLYNTSSIRGILNNSLGDVGLGSYQNIQADPNATGPTSLGDPNFAGPTYNDGKVFAPGTAFGSPAASAVTVPYYFPASNQNRTAGSLIPANQRDVAVNNSGIFKLQYQKNIGQNAYVRAYGYSLYSDESFSGPVSSYALYNPGVLPESGAVLNDYELDTHTRGGEIQLADQINDKNQLTLTANYTTASLVRFNNTTNLRGNGSSATNLTDAAGNCYRYTTGAQNSCFSSTTAGTYGDPTRTAACAALAAKGTPCAATPAGTSFIVTTPGETGTYNTVSPEFTSYSFTDQFKPNDKLLLNAGVRYETFKYNLPSSDTPDFRFWYRAAQNSFCYDPQTLQPVRVPLPPGAQPPAPALIKTTCPNNANGVATVHPDGQNGHILYSPSSVPYEFNSVVEPRIGGTYAFNPDTVVRFSYGYYAEPSKSASTQYISKAARSAANNNFINFFGLGFYNVSHDVKVQTSSNYDLSLEKHLKGTSVSFKLSPYYRDTKNQQNTITIGPNFASDLNVGAQKSFGVEFQTNFGSPDRDGFSGQLAYSYTHARIRFTNAPNGRNAVDFINDDIDAYNALTAQGNRFGVKGSPCYANSGKNTPTACSDATAILNPYFNKPSQGLLDRNGQYVTYPNSFPGSAGTADGFATNVIPDHTIAGFISYKRDRFTITPSAQFNTGGHYGGPTGILGLDPRVCTQNSADAGITALSPNTNPLQANYLMCGFALSTAGGLAVPNPATGVFDRIGQYTEPNHIALNVALGYELNKKSKINLTLANLVNTCFGGSKNPSSSAYGPSDTICRYAGSSTYVSNFYNGTGPNDLAANGAAPLRVNLQPYQPIGNASRTFQAFLNYELKL